MLLMKSAERKNFTDEIRRENDGCTIDWGLHDGDGAAWPGGCSVEGGGRVIRKSVVSDEMKRRRPEDLGLGIVEDGSGAAFEKSGSLRAIGGETKEQRREKEKR